MRCLILADALQKRGAISTFVCRESDGDLISAIRGQGFPVMPLLRSTRADQTRDAEETIRSLAGERPDWLIVDHYGLDGEWETRLRPWADRICVITDLDDRHHNCDLLLNQNYAASEERLRSLCTVANHVHILSGPRFALLNAEYHHRRAVARQRDGHVRKVLLFFGGTDSENATGLALEALSRPDFLWLEVDVVVGVNNPHRGALEAMAAMRPRTTIHGMQPTLVDLMADADLAIGAGGITTWERMCLGLPAIVVSIADNQRTVCEALSAGGFILYVGELLTVDSHDLVKALQDAIRDAACLRELSARGLSLVDGLGALRLVEAISQTPLGQLTLRATDVSDVELYFQWANDPEVRRQSITSEPIPWIAHQAWFDRQMSNPLSSMFVLMAGDLPVGQIRFDRRGEYTWINYSLDCLVRRRGWGAVLVSLGCAAVDRTSRLRAEVKADNRASRAIFARLGFETMPSDSGPGTVVFAAPVRQGSSA